VCENITGKVKEKEEKISKAKTLIFILDNSIA